MVGDNYETDIQAGIRNNIDTLLVLSGFTKKKMYLVAYPSYLCETITGWMELLIWKFEMAVDGICWIVQPISDTDQSGSWCDDQLSTTIRIWYRTFANFGLYFFRSRDVTENFDHLMNYLNNPSKPSSACQISQFLLAEPITFMKWKFCFSGLCCVFITLIPSILFIKYLQKNDRLWRLIRPFQIGMLLPVVFGFSWW